ncbi:uncharacterized protein FMAN_11092 [Fusarium mangiferae]|uniref:Uncharacterized protein n=1 Tax=Fusarium mangiferae TaxID=192010 RepID=A0A1L7TKT7_FUSMA|nr:uncharacterized protein FMAN_11092 [Fusarium mangiferae]CVK96763.1 uncharacterized protein FMAN_11092 [Fusarium mangiferae]
MNDIRQRHRAKCLEFFKDRYEQRIHYYGLIPYEMPTKSTHNIDPLLPFLLNDKSFYQARLYASDTSQTFEMAKALWESLGMSPGDYTGLLEFVSNPRSAFWARYHDKALSNTTHIRYHKEMSLVELLVALSGWPKRDQDLAHRTIVTTMETYMHYLLGHHYGAFWTLKPMKQNNHMYPLEFGLMVYIEEQWKNIAWVYLDCAVPAIPNLDMLGDVESSLMDRIEKDKVFGENEKRETPRSVHVLFSSAGTGKTRQIFELLQKQWGFYLLAPNLAPKAELSRTDGKDHEGMDIIDTKRYSASRDTYTMFEDHPQMIPEWISKEINVFRPLIVARVALLYEFLRRYPSPTPRQWLWLQVSCDNCDPFDALYRLFRLSADQYLWWDEYVYVWAEIPGFIIYKCYSFLSKEPNQFFKGSLYHCFDEAQLTLDDPQASSMLRHLYETLTLTYVVPWASANNKELVDRHMEDPESDARSLQTSDEMPYVDPILVLLGTSLRLEVLQENLATYSSDAWGEGEETVTKWDSYRIDDTFQLIASDADFWALYEKHTTDILKEFRTFRGVKETVTWSSLPLLSRSGRPLPFESSEVDFDSIEAWVRRPLEVPTTQEFLVLVMQAHCLMESDKISTDIPRVQLEELLENRDSEAVASLVTLSLVQLLEADTVPGADSLGLSLLELLAEHGNIAIEEMSSIMQNIFSRVATPNTSLSGIAATLHTGLRNLHVRNMIKLHSIGQRGRYRWSTVYIEELMMLYPRLTAPGSTLSEIQMIIEEAESRTIAAAINALKDQIRKMKSAGKEQLVQELFRAGIRAEMMSSPSIFVKRNFAQLVTHGFALVQKDGDTIRYTFSEPIAVRAVMEYLRTEGGDDYQDLMLQWLVHTQDDYEVRAMLGKATEWFVAMSFDRLLRPQLIDQAGQLSLLERSSHRESLLKYLSESIAIDSNTQQMFKLSSVVRISDFSLPESQKAFRYETPCTIWDWLKQQRSGDQVSTPTFIFPDINAGPDLVFLLQKQFTGSTRHSIKTGRGARFEDAMETLLDCNWHKNLKSATREAEARELQHWGDTPFILLLVCTGITVRQTRLQSWIRKNYDRIKANHFICVLDKSVASSIWGSDFAALVDAIRRQDSQEGKGWEQQIRKHS